MINFYPESYGNRKEIDLRKELHETLFGGLHETEKGQIVIFRRMRRKPGITYPVTEDDLQISPSQDKFSHHAPREHPDNWSFGERFLFDDRLIKLYRSWPISIENTNTLTQIDPGWLPGGLAFYYLEAWTMPSVYDKIIEVVRDMDGVPVSPLRLERKYSVKSAEAFRSDSGRVEFWRLT